MATKVERILILAKTYPSPSAKHTETSCVAGINEHGEARRLYPVPFRMVAENQQFQKWQWITVRIEKSPADHRPESHKVYVDTIEVGNKIPTANGWASRRPWWEMLPMFDSFTTLDTARELQDISLALLRPKRLVKLEISPVDNPNWTEEEMAKLIQQQSQGNLFSQDEERKQLKLLEKLPFDFYYHYVCDTPDGEQVYKHKIVDWEVGMLYRTCKRTYGTQWEAQFRAKLEQEFGKKDLLFMMGNIHRFQHQWLIISLFYPPKPASCVGSQVPLF
ncbi:hypothetical protein [Massilia orientalis]|uniref:Uncharacterized protein n=1 Tax=Massilia orientalis TaxID=3050128 RepID=A0ACC7MH26_9BURK|nr:hypothetical protein [Massilia sp. YIM B02787]